MPKEAVFVMKPKTVEERRAWAAITSVDNRLIEPLWKLMYWFAGIILVGGVIVVVYHLLDKYPIWYWAGLVVSSGGMIIVFYFQFSLRMKLNHPNYFPSDEYREILKILSTTELKSYRVLYCIVILLPAFFLVGSVSFFVSPISINTVGWVLWAGGLLLTVSLVYLLIQRTRDLVKKMVSRTAEQL